MDPTENDDTELEIDDAGATGEADDTADDLSDSTPSGDDQGSGADDTPAGPKSAAEALSAGIDALAGKSKKEGDKAGSETEDGKGGPAKEGADKKDAADGKKGEGEGKTADGKPKADDKLDHVNDPIDARLAPRTQERIRSLADEVKTLREVSTNNGAMIGAIMDSGATPDEFGALVAYMHWTHSEEPAQLEQAYALLQSELQGVALRLGRAIPEVDWLSGHQDLIDGIKGGLMTRDTAVELAMHRATVKRNKDQTTAKATKDNATRDQTAQTAKDQTTAIAELDTLGDELAAADPQYAAKYAILVPKLKAEFAKIPPSQWKTKFLEEYAKTRIKAAPPAGVPPKQNTPKPQPLRPSTPSGDTKKAPGSALDALSSAIDGMRG